MNLYLLRHGIAVPNDDPENVPDSDRPLTPKGMPPNKAGGLHWLLTPKQLRALAGAAD